MVDKRKLTDFPDIRSIESEALEWVIKLDSGSLSESSHDEFRIWRSQSHVHKEALIRACEFWEGLDGCRGMELDRAELAIDVDGCKRKQNSGPVVVKKTPRLQAMAACIFVFMLVAGLYSMTGFESAVNTEHFQTAIGSQKSIRLSDDSRVQLNTNTVIEVSFSNSRRLVKLLQGEAHFDVKRDVNRPFEVAAGNGIVSAVGTAFSVRLSGEEVEVVVTDGSVELQSYANSSTDKTGKVTPINKASVRDLAKLSVGQNAVFDSEIREIKMLSHERLDRKLAWREGLLKFSGEPLSQIVNDVSRYTAVSISIENPDIASFPVGGVFSIGDLEAIFGAIEYSLDVQISWLDENHVVIR